MLLLLLLLLLLLWFGGPVADYLSGEICHRGLTLHPVFHQVLSRELFIKPLYVMCPPQPGVVEKWELAGCCRAQLASTFDKQSAVANRLTMKLASSK